MARKLGMVALGVAAAHPAAAQVVLDRADPTIIQRSVPQPPLTRNTAPEAPPVVPPVAARSAPLTGVVRAITVDGQHALPPALFAEAIAPVIGRDLGRDELARLAGAIADIARARGYPFASATVPPQPLTNGIPQRLPSRPGRRTAATP